MATTRTIEELIQALDEHPDWKPRLLRSLLTDEFLRLPADVAELRRETAETRAELVELRAETERRFQALEASTRALEASTRALEASTRALEESVRGLVESHRSLEAKVDGIQGERAGEKYERDKRRFAFYLFRGGRDVTDEILESLREASLAGTVAPDDAEDASRLDFVWEKRVEARETAVLLAVEVSLVVDGTDGRRARRRASVLASIPGESRRVVPVVIGERFTGEDAAGQAAELGVEWILEEAAGRRLSDGLRPIVMARSVK